MTKAKKTATTEERRVFPPLRRMSQLEHAFPVFVANPNPEMTLEDCLQPEYWRTLQRDLEPNCEIKIIPDGADWEAKVRVMAIPSTGPVFRLLDYVKDKEAIHIEPDIVHLGGQTWMICGNYKVTYTNASKWRVIRESDSVEMATGLETKEKAFAEAAQCAKIDTKIPVPKG